MEESDEREPGTLNLSKGAGQGIHDRLITGAPENPARAFQSLKTRGNSTWEMGASDRRWKPWPGSRWARRIEPEQHVFTYYINSPHCVPALHNCPAAKVLAPVHSEAAEAQRTYVVCPRPQRSEVVLPGSKTQPCGSGVRRSVSRMTMCDAAEGQWGNGKGGPPAASRLDTWGSSLGTALW